MQDQRKPTPEARTEATFARRLRELRDQLDLSQARLAEKISAMGLKIDDLAILRIEKNADAPGRGRRVRLGEAAVIARALGVRLDEMIRTTATLDEQLAAATAKLDFLENRRYEVHGLLEHTQRQLADARRERDELRGLIEGAEEAESEMGPELEQIKSGDPGVDVKRARERIKSERERIRARTKD